MADEVATVTVEQVQAHAEFNLVERFERVFVETKVEAAVEFVLDECPAVVDRLLSGALSVVNYRRIVAEVALRVLRNVGGVKSESDTGYAIALDPLVASGTYWIPEKDRKTLLGVVTKSAPAGTVSIGLDAGWSR
jgi:hypothetical protein